VIITAQAGAEELQINTSKTSMIHEPTEYFPLFNVLVASNWTHAVATNLTTSVDQTLLNNSNNITCTL